MVISFFLKKVIRPDHALSENKRLQISQIAVHLSNKKLKSITKLVPCSKIHENDVHTQKLFKFIRNKLTLKEKLEIIKLRDNGVSSVKIARDRDIAESSVRVIYSKKDKLQFQGTLANPSQNRT